MENIGLHIAFRAGFRWPLRHGDVVELWSGVTKLGTISAATVLNLVGHHYATIKVQEQMRDELSAPPPMRQEITTARKPPAKSLPVTRDQMVTRRENRRRHRRNS